MNTGQESHVKRLVVMIMAVVLIGIGAVLTVSDATFAQQGAVPGNSLGTSSDAEFWRAIRQGAQGKVSIPDQQAAVLIQSEGDNWRAFRNGPLSTYGVWGFAGIGILLALFFLIRGRIRIEAGRSGDTVTRFRSVERFGHWLLAVSFIILGLSGLNMLYGRYVLIPVTGPEVFAAITFWGKWLHNYVAFAFMVGLALIFLMWLKDNLPSRHDIGWIIRLGGLFSKHSHPPAKKFNPGQKLIFWIVVLGGASLSLSGIALMFPFEYAMFAKTFEIMNMFGFKLPTELTAMQEMQLSQLWHSIVGLILMVVIVAHIYIGTIGMEGAFDAMGSGEVDTNWAREHHSLWMDKVAPAKPAPPVPDKPEAGGPADDGAAPQTQPAE